MYTENKFFLSLFSGAGGFTYGFQQAGLTPICGIEINKDACNTYEQNISSECHNLDISEIAPNDVKKLTGKTKPFVVIGGPPCQGFSTAGSRIASDPRNKLIFSYLNIVSRVKPEWFIFENVEGLLTSGNGDALYSLVSEFLKIGYSVRLQKVNAAAYGVPQTRKRVLIIGNRMGIDFLFPDENYSFMSGKSKKHSEKPFSPTLSEALAGLGTPSHSKKGLVEYNSPQPANHYDSVMRIGNEKLCVTQHYSINNDSDEKIFALLKPGQTMRDLPQEYWHESFKKRAFRRVMDGTPTEKRGGAPSGVKRLHGDYQCLTITGASSREFIHFNENRPLTIRECARIQTFPDKYEFQGNAASIIQQIGNAVPPMLAEVFANHLMNIHGKFGSDLQSSKQYSTPQLLGYNLTDANGMSPALKNTDMLLSKLMSSKQLEIEFV